MGQHVTELEKKQYYKRAKLNAQKKAKRDSEKAKKDAEKAKLAEADKKKDEAEKKEAEKPSETDEAMKEALRQGEL